MGLLDITKVPILDTRKISEGRIGMPTAKELDALDRALPKAKKMLMDRLAKVSAINEAEEYVDKLLGE